MGIVSKIVNIVMFVICLAIFGVVYLMFIAKGALTAWIEGVFVNPILALGYVQMIDCIIILLLVVGLIGISIGLKKIFQYIIQYIIQYIS